MFDYESISSISSITPKGAVKQAKETLELGWAVGGYPRVVLSSSEIPWKLRSESERSWNFHLHSWNMLDALLKAYCETRELRFLDVSLQVALDWIEHLQEAEASPFAWYDMAVGLRAYRLAYMIDAAERCGLLIENISEKLWESLEEHQKFLSDDGNIIFHNNHGFYQAAGQLAMGRRFAYRSDLMRDALDQGRGRLLEMLHMQFSSEGVHMEHSPDYHRMVYMTLQGVLDAGLIEDPAIQEFAGKIEKALYWFIQPNCRLANFGDSDYRSLEATAEQAIEKWRSDAMQFAVSGGRCGAPPKEQGLAVFEEGGYFVVKKPISAERNELEMWGYLAQQACFHSRTHKHADSLSLIWHEHGHDILVDSGRYGYLGRTEQGSDLWKDGHWYSDPKRVYCESTRAHNTLEFDGKNQPRKGVKPSGSMIGRHTFQDGVYMLETEARYQRGLRHARVLFYFPGRWLLVYDWYKDNLGVNHDARQWFHLSPELRAETEDDGYKVVVPGAPNPLQVRPCLLNSDSTQVLRGETEPDLQGWWSGRERELVPADAFAFRQFGSSQGQFATLFTFEEQLECDLELSKVASSGRQGGFIWRVGKQVHRLEFTRKSGKKLSVSYTGQAPERKSKSSIGAIFKSLLSS